MIYKYTIHIELQPQNHTIHFYLYLGRLYMRFYVNVRAIDGMRICGYT